MQRLLCVREREREKEKDHSTRDCRNALVSLKTTGPDEGKIPEERGKRKNKKKKRERRKKRKKKI